MDKKISVANLVMLAGGVITLLFSFFRFVSFDSGFGSGGFSAWSTDGFAFASTIPAILAIAMIAWVVCELAGVKLPDQVLTYNSSQLKGTWGIAAAGTMLAWLIANDSKGIGFWFMLIGSLAMAAGAVMALLGKGTEVVDLGKIGGGNGGQQAPAAGFPGSVPPPPPGAGAPPPPPPPPAGPGAPPPPPPPLR
jgi:hypothetical protein